MIRLVDELGWLDAIIGQSGQVPRPDPVAHQQIAVVKQAVAAILEQCSALLAATGGDLAALHAAMARLQSALAEMEQRSTTDLPVRRGPVAGDRVEEFLSR